MKLEVRRYNPETDAKAVDEIYERCHGHFNIPWFRHCVELAVVVMDDSIIAFGAFELIPEVTLILDKDVPKRYQAMALDKLLDAGETVAKLYDYNEIYAFPDTKGYAEILKKHYNFKDCDPILIKRFNDGE